MTLNLVIIIAVAGLTAWAFDQVLLGYLPKPEDITCLTRKEYGFVHAVADTLFPKGGAIEISGEEARVSHYIDDYLCKSPALQRILMKALFFLMEHATVITFAGITRFSRLPMAKRVKYLEGWEFSRFYFRRIAFLSLRALIAMAYFACPEVEKAIGYDHLKNCDYPQA